MCLIRWGLHKTEENINCNRMREMYSCFLQLMLILLEKVHRSKPSTLYQGYDGNVVPMINLITPRSQWVSVLGKMLVPMEYNVAMADLKDINRILLKLNRRLDFILQL